MAEATPDAAELAAAHSIDLSDVKGSGADGKILKADVRKLIPSVEEDYGIPEDRPVPEEFANMPASWHRAYAHAANYSKHNGVKACVIYADTRMHDQEYQDAPDS